MVIFMSENQYQGKWLAMVVSVVCLLGLSVFSTQAFADVRDKRGQSGKAYFIILTQSLRLASARIALLVKPKNTSISKATSIAKNTSTTRRCKRQIRYRKICKTRHRTLRRCGQHEVNVKKCKNVPVQRKHCQVRIKNVTRCRGPLGQQECGIVKQRRRVCQTRTEQVLRCKKIKKQMRRCRDIRKPVRICEKKKYYIRRCKRK